MAFPALILQTFAALCRITFTTYAAAVIAPGDELAAVSVADSLESSQDLAKRVDRLIEQLGDPRFPVRERTAFRKDLYSLGYPPALVKRALYVMDPSVGASRQPALLPDPAQDVQIASLLRKHGLVTDASA